MIKKIFLIVVALFGLLSFQDIVETVYAEETKSVDLYLFHGDGCPHCAKERAFLEKLSGVYGSEINIYQFEVYYNQENSKLFNDVTENLGVDVAGVPFLVIGDEEIVGYGTDATTGKEIRERIDTCLEKDCPNKIGEKILDGLDKNNVEVLGENIVIDDREIEEDSSTGENVISVPIFGNVDLSKLSLPVATFLIAFMDGFNPCAMWILIFLITMLINMEDKKRLYTLGSIFIITSGAVYFIFLAAWFNFFKFIGYAYWIKVVIGIVAIVSGYLHVKNGLESEGACKVVDPEKRRSIMDKIKDITKEKSFYIAIAGIITLAVSVNLIEVVCSAGLPSIYTNLLASANLSLTKYYMYLLFYTVIFMLDDLVIFFIAVKTFEITGITSKYTKWSSIIGGALIFIIGILLIFKPDLLMFG